MQSSLSFIVLLLEMTSFTLNYEIFCYTWLFAEKPHITKSPQDKTVEEDRSVQFQCQAEGDPAPTIVWKRESGQIPGSRWDLCVYVYVCTFVRMRVCVCVCVCVGNFSPQKSIEAVGEKSENKIDTRPSHRWMSNSCSPVQ